MKYVKTYEQIKSLIDPFNRSGSGDTDHEEFNIGDIVTCIENRPNQKYLKLGNEYEIVDKVPKFFGKDSFYYWVKNLETNRKIKSGFSAYNFTKDVEEYRARRDAEKYNM